MDCLAVLIILSIINGIVFLATSTIGFNNDVNISETYSSNIKNINIDVCSTNMIIKKGDILSIDADNVSKKFKIKEQGNTLSIKEKKITSLIIIFMILLYRQIMIEFCLRCEKNLNKCRRNYEDRNWDIYFTEGIRVLI